MAHYRVGKGERPKKRKTTIKKNWGARQARQKQKMGHCLVKPKKHQNKVGE